MIALVEVHEPQYRREDDEYVAVAVILLMRCNIELTRKEFEEGDVDGGGYRQYYAKGTSGATGTRASGQLKQYGSKKLAENGYSYKQILNYYYSGSSVSYGDVNLFGYNIGY